MKTLPIAVAGRPLALLSHERQPVWPTRTWRHKTLLQRLTSVFECSLVERPKEHHWQRH